MAITSTQELLDPLSGEIIEDPTIEDAYRIYRAINEFDSR